MDPILFHALSTAGLLFCSAFFSGSETALFSIPREQIPVLQNSPQIQKRWIAALLIDAQRTLMVILLGNIFVNILIVTHVYALSRALFSQASAMVTMVAATTFLVIFGEVVPKSIALRYNIFFASLAAIILMQCKRILYPLIKLTQYITSIFLHQFLFILKKPAPFVTPQELQSAITTGIEQKVISTTEGRIMQQLCANAEMPLEAIARHRTEIAVCKQGQLQSFVPPPDTTHIVIVDQHKHWHPLGVIELTPSQALEAGREVHVQKTLALPHSAHLAEVAFILDEHQKAPALSRKAEKKKKPSLCHDPFLVIDEFGGLYGLCYHDDVFQALFGSNSPQRTTHQSSVELSALQPAETVRELLPPTLQKLCAQHATLNGVLTDYLQRIPGEKESFEIDSHRFYIISATPTRINSVLIEKFEVI